MKKIKKPIFVCLIVLSLLFSSLCGVIANAITAPIEESGYWTIEQTTDNFNNSYSNENLLISGFDSLDFYYMQTEDNQEFTLTQNFVMYRNKHDSDPLLKFWGLKLYTDDIDVSGSNTNMIPKYSAENGTAEFMNAAVTDIIDNQFASWTFNSSYAVEGNKKLFNSPGDFVMSNGTLATKLEIGKKWGGDYYVYPAISTIVFKGDGKDMNFVYKLTWDSRQSNNGGNPYTTFKTYIQSNIHITDIRDIIATRNWIDNEIKNNAAKYTPAAVETASLILNAIPEDKFDGSVYYDNTVADSLRNVLNNAKDNLLKNRITDKTALANAITVANSKINAGKLYDNVVANELITAIVNGQSMIDSTEYNTYGSVSDTENNQTTMDAQAAVILALADNLVEMDFSAYNESVENAHNISNDSGIYEPQAFAEFTSALEEIENSIDTTSETNQAKVDAAKEDIDRLIETINDQKKTDKSEIEKLADELSEVAENIFLPDELKQEITDTLDAITEILNNDDYNYGKENQDTIDSYADNAEDLLSRIDGLDFEHAYELIDEMNALKEEIITNLENESSDRTFPNNYSKDEYIDYVDGFISDLINDTIDAMKEYMSDSDEEINQEEFDAIAESAYDYLVDNQKAFELTNVLILKYCITQLNLISQKEDEFTSDYLTECNSLLTTALEVYNNASLQTVRDITTGKEVNQSVIDGVVNDVINFLLRPEYKADYSELKAEIDTIKDIINNHQDDYDAEYLSDIADEFADYCDSIDWDCSQEQQNTVDEYTEHLNEFIEVLTEKNYLELKNDSSYKDENDIIKNVLYKTAVKDFVSEFDNDSTYIEVRNFEDTILGDDDFVGTKSVIYLKSRRDNRILDSKIVLVMGDTDGDGLITNNDYVNTKTVALSVDNIVNDDLFSVAMDMDFDTVIDVIDAFSISRLR